ncbi:hypothetical protein E1B28_002782 [Marasmius oreades]|uniref:Uncharacterized protein n=1 Tax=Marasmius oreades TaxID=181124 RepID=A0A9P7RNG1_9AGAR|nr:uncharacterized protein E1B28_002782 [Marasmius oreades]KAG7086861.1 hypothetical protein E1B28_002782 [Marasmius oreades]
MKTGSPRCTYQNCSPLAYRIQPSWILKPSQDRRRVLRQHDSEYLSNTSTILLDRQSTLLNCDLSFLHKLGRDFRTTPRGPRNAEGFEPRFNHAHRRAHKRLKSLFVAKGILVLEEFCATLSRNWHINWVYCHQFVQHVCMLTSRSHSRCRRHRGWFEEWFPLNSGEADRLTVTATTRNLNF